MTIACLFYYKRSQINRAVFCPAETRCLSIRMNNGSHAKYKSMHTEPPVEPLKQTHENF